MAASGQTAEKVTTSDGATSCEHCGALVFDDSIRCRQCGRFPVKLHRCARCGSISAKDESKCWKCGRVFPPDGDYL